MIFETPVLRRPPERFDEPEFESAPDEGGFDDVEPASDFALDFDSDFDSDFDDEDDFELEPDFESEDPEPSLLEDEPPP